MPKSTKICVITIAVLFIFFSSGYANSNSRISNEYQRLTKRAIENQPTPYTPSFTRGGILFVEDPADTGFGPATKPDPLWTNTLNDLLGTGNYGWFGPTTDPTANGPDLSTMQNYDLVIWNCYDFWWDDMALTSTDQTNLQDYINGGGKVWLLGQDIIYSGVPTAWLATNFHLSSVSEDYCNDATSLNIQGLAEINGYTFTTYCDYQSNGFWCDALTPDAQAHHIIQDLTYNQYNSIAYPNTAPLQTSFWTVDGRNPSNYNEWLNMVYGMLEAFGVYGVAEIPQKAPARNISIIITPSILRYSVSINYNIPVSGETEITIYDKTGKAVKTLVNKHKSAGVHKVIWDGKDEEGTRVANGVYFVKASCGKYTCSSVLTVIK
ncbi:MAG: FlgD immunoglobulin-like domain containing protein [candidate division WOR-3 bacterium]